MNRKNIEKDKDELKGKIRSKWSETHNHVESKHDEYNPSAHLGKRPVLKNRRVRP
jgi:hypothetical protein